MEHLSPSKQCPNCKAVSPQKIACPSCGQLYPFDEKLSYFDVFMMPPTLHLDDTELRTRFYELSKLCHPDKFISEQAPVRHLAANWSQLVNRAYQTLRSPESRSQYLLSYYGVQENKDAKIPQNLAETYFEIQELMEAGPSDKALVEPFHKQLLQALEENQRTWNSMASQWDATQSPAIEKLQALNQNLIERRFLDSMILDMKSKFQEIL